MIAQLIGFFLKRMNPLICRHQILLLKILIPRKSPFTKYIMVWLLMIRECK